MSWWQWVLAAGAGWLAASFLGGLVIGQFIEAGKGPRRRRPARSRPGVGGSGHDAGRRDPHDTGAAA